MGLLALKGSKGKPLLSARRAAQASLLRTPSRGPQGGEFCAPGASSEAVPTREAVLERLQAALKRIGEAYPEGLLKKLTEEQERPLLEAERFIDEALQAGDLGKGLREVENLERAWVETIRGHERGET